MSAYREPAEKPEWTPKKYDMGEREQEVAVVRTIAVAIVATILGGGGLIATSSWYSTWAHLQEARIVADPGAQAALRDRAIAEKAAADRAMFESMACHGGGK